MATAFHMVSHDNTHAITLFPCACGECTQSVLIVAKSLGRKVRKLEMTLTENDLDELLDAVQKIKEFQAKKGHGTC